MTKKTQDNFQQDKNWTCEKSEMQEKIQKFDSLQNNWTKDKSEMQQDMDQLQSLLEDAQNNLSIPESCEDDVSSKLTLEQVSTKSLEDQLDALRRTLDEAQVELDSQKRLRLDAEKETQALFHKLRPSECEAYSKAQQLEKAFEQEVKAARLRLRLYDTTQLLRRVKEKNKKVEELKNILQQEQAQTEKLRRNLCDVGQTLRKEEEALDRARASHCTELDKQQAQMSRIKEELKRTEELLKAQRSLFEQEKRAQEEEKENFRAACLSQLEEDKVKVMTALENKLETLALQWQQEKASLLDDLRTSKHSSEELISNQRENISLSAGLKDSRDSLNGHLLIWEEDQTSIQKDGETCEWKYMVELEELKADNEKLMADLKMVERQMKMVERQMETDQTAWQEERSSLLQATEELKDAARSREQEWETKESLMKVHVEKLEEKIRKKTTKWYKRLFRRK